MPELKQARKFKKDDIRPNQEYLESWDEYQLRAVRNNRSRREPLLLPVRVDMEDGVITRERIKANDIQKLWNDCKCEVPDELLDPANRWAFPDMDKVFQDYIDAFPNDFAESSLPPSPLDIFCMHPTFILYHLPRENWKFTEASQYSVENDPDDYTRNFEKICTFENRNYLLISNRHTSGPDDLKFNLHVTVHQTENGKDLFTPIIIDPAGVNGGSQWP